MPITVKYQPDASLVGEAAFLGGQGRFAQAQDQFNLGQDQFDQKLAENQRQFDQRLDYQQQLALLQDRRAGLGQAQQAYQFDAGLESRERQGAAEGLLRRDLADAGRQTQYDLAALSAQDQEANRTSREGIAEAGRKAQLKSQLTGIEAANEKQRYMTAIAAANAIQDEKGSMMPGQFEQAVEQWVDRYGAGFDNQFPFQTSFHGAQNTQEVGQIKANLAAAVNLPLEDPRIEGLMHRAFQQDHQTGQWVERPDAVRAIENFEKEENARLYKEDSLAATVKVAEARLTAETEKAKAARTAAQSDYTKKQRDKAISVQVAQVAEARKSWRNAKSQPNEEHPNEIKERKADLDEELAELARLKGEQPMPVFSSLAEAAAAGLKYPDRFRGPDGRTWEMPK